MIYLGYRINSVNGLAFKEKIDLAVKLKMTAVELGPQDIADADNSKLREMADTAKAAGIKMKSLGVGAIETCKPALKDSQRAVFNDVIEKAKLLDLDFLLCRALNPEPGVKQSETWECCADSFRLFSGMCEDNGIKFGLEVDHGCFIQNLERAEYLFEKVNHKNLYLNYDPANLYIGGSDPITVIDHLKDLIVSGHIKDGVYRTDKKGETKIGEGEVDYPAIFRKLEQENISIAMHLEHLKSAQDVIDGVGYIQGVLDRGK